MTTTAGDFLSLVGLGKSYGPNRVVEGLNLTVARNEFITLLGPSGCGKTTTLRMIAGFVQPTEGEILLQGKMISSPSLQVPPERRNIGMVFQSYAVWPHMTVRENIQLPLRLRKLPTDEIRRRTDKVLDLCRLSSWADRSPHQLSGGQLQRVALARALAYRPSLVLLDEPLSNLDVALREELREELHQLHKQLDATFILVTHDQVEAMSLSDRIVVMRDGRVEQVGPPHEIYRSPATNFVASFTGTANVMTGDVVAIDAGGVFCKVRVSDSLQLTAATWPDAVVGEKVSLAVHPEALQIHVGAWAPGVQNQIPARVVKSSFLGRTQEVLLDVQGMQMRAVALRAEFPPEGSNVMVSIAATSVVAIGRARGAAHKQNVAAPQPLLAA
jgi:iron(III) transport system ATP-binding protein